MPSPFLPVARNSSLFDDRLMIKTSHEIKFDVIALGVRA